MKYLSLFSGIGGFELGIEHAYESLCNAHGSQVGRSQENAKGTKGQGFLTSKGKDIGSKKRSIGAGASNRTYKRPLCIGYSEIDKYAIQIYQKHFPEHKNYGDIKKINEKELPDFELLVGGFPCQSFSIAGHRKGFADTRGTLFFEICRIIGEKRPRLILLENVKGLLSHDGGRTFFVIISTLDELGYDIQWQVLNSKDFGVPQNRERVLIVGNLRGTPRPQVFPFGKNYREDKKQPIANTITASYWKGIDNHGQRTHIGTTKENPIILSGQPQYGDGKRKVTFKETNISPTIRATQAKNGDNQPYLLNDMQIRRLTPKECERLQGFPDDWTKWGREHSAEEDKRIVMMKGSHIIKPVLMSDTQRYKTCGNAVTTNVIQAVMEKLL